MTGYSDRFPAPETFLNNAAVVHKRGGYAAVFQRWRGCLRNGVQSACDFSISSGNACAFLKDRSRQAVFHAANVLEAGRSPMAGYRILPTPNGAIYTMLVQQLHTASHTPDHLDSRTRLIEAAIRLIRTEGYSATSAEGIAAAAGVSKGSLYHHFPDKEDLTIVAIEHWRREKAALFATAPYRKITDPAERLLAYVDFQQKLIQGGLPEFTCLLGTLAQTVYARYPAIRTACAAAIEEHNGFLRADVAEAFRRYGVGDERNAGRFAAFMQASLQGAFVLAKAQSNPAVAIECLEELKQSIGNLFNPVRARTRTAVTASVPVAAYRVDGKPDEAVPLQANRLP